MKYSYKISIVVPVYNAEKFLGKCLASLMSQTMNYTDFEILLINDGSNDNSANICKMWQEKYSNISYYEKENAGVSDTRNKGMKEAKGKYILFLDPDDFLSKNALLDIYTFFDAHYDEIDMVTYPMILVYPNGHKKMHSRYKKDFDNHNAIYNLNKHYLLVQATINICIKNNGKYQFDTNQFYSEDEQFNTKILMEKKKLGYVSSARYYYRQHSNSVTAKKNTYDMEKVYTFHNELQEKYQNHPYIQSIIINNLRWRINQECLYPENLSPDKIYKYLQPVVNRLNKVDFSLFNNYLSNSMLLELLALSNQKIETKRESKGTYSIYYHENLLLGDLKIQNEISYLNVKNNKLQIEGSISTALYHDRKVIVYADISYKDNHHEKIELRLGNKIEYKNRVSKVYQLEVDANKVSKISFMLLADDENYQLITKNTEWCAKCKVLENYQISVGNTIKIKKKKFYNYIINKFRGCFKPKFFIINFLSVFSKEGKHTNVYFGDKNSELYELYLKDNHKKIFVSNANKLNYKLQILNCDKLITNKSIRTVLPFGSMRKYYIQASKCNVIKKP